MEEYKKIAFALLEQCKSKGLKDYEISATLSIAQSLNFENLMASKISSKLKRIFEN